MLAPLFCNTLGILTKNEDRCGNAVTHLPHHWLGIFDSKNILYKMNVNFNKNVFFPPLKARDALQKQLRQKGHPVPGQVRGKLRLP